MLVFPSTSTENKLMLQKSIQEMQDLYDKKHNRAIEMKKKEIVTLIDRLVYWLEQQEDSKKIADLTMQIISKIQELSVIGGTQHELDSINNLFNQTTNTIIA